jgi:Tol biopolymer transport system component
MRTLAALLLVSAALAAGSAGAAEAPVAEILSVRLDGSDARHLGAADGRGAMRGPGRRIFFVRAADDGRGAFWVMNEDGSELRQLGASPMPGDDYDGPVWSPDGRTVGMTRWDASLCTSTWWKNCAASVLVLVDAESGAEQLVLRARDRGAGWLSWAPDGSRLAFASELNSDRAARAIETIRPDGSGRRVVVRLAAGAPGIHGLAWSPRGDHIAYDRGPGGWIRLVPARGGASTKLVRGRAPVWSPKGRRLLFRPRDDSIGIVDVATRRTRVLSFGAEVGGATWSPDGERIAFLFRRWNTGVSSIAVVRVSDGRRLHTWQPGRDIASLFFSRDGTRLIYTRRAA